MLVRALRSETNAEASHKRSRQQTTSTSNRARTRASAVLECYNNNPGLRNDIMSERGQGSKLAIIFTSVRAQAVLANCWPCAVLGLACQQRLQLNWIWLWARAGLMSKRKTRTRPDFAHAGDLLFVRLVVLSQLQRPAYLRRIGKLIGIGRHACTVHT